MSTGIDQERILKPIQQTTRNFWILFAALALGILLMVEAWSHQIQYGIFAVTGLGDWGIGGEVPWGLYIGGFVWWVGVAHGGIAISAAVRVLNIDRYQVIARIAEILTILALTMAAFNVVIDLGRPDRIFNTVLQWPFTVHHSPLAWDIAVISLYLVLSLTYLTLSLRAEIVCVRDQLPRHFAPVYAFITFGYSSEEDAKVQQILWWMAVAILALVPLLSGGVVPWLFSLIGAQPGWFGAAAGAAMLTESLTSAVAGVLIVAVIFRYAYGWHDIIEDRIIRDLAIVMAFLALGTLWFTLHNVLTGYYMPPVNIGAMTEGMLGLHFFWIAIVGLIGSVIALFSMIAWPERFFNAAAVGVISAVLAITILNKKVMFVVEGLMHPTSPPLTNLYADGWYTPTLPEWILFSGTIFLVALGFLVLTKVIPMIEIEPDEVDA